MKEEWKCFYKYMRIMRNEMIIFATIKALSV